MVAIICGRVEHAAGLFPDRYFDACFADPPYLLGFMGREFDLAHKLKPGANEGQRMGHGHRVGQTQYPGKWYRAGLFQY